MTSTFLPDVSEWVRKTERLDTPLLAAFGKAGPPYSEYDGALIGYTPSPHPRLARLMRRPQVALFGLQRQLLRIAGYDLAAYSDTDDECGCEVVSTGRGLARLSKRNGNLMARWMKQEPIYDEVIIAENRRKIADRPKATWDWAPMDPNIHAVVASENGDGKVYHLTDDGLIEQ